MNMSRTPRVPPEVMARKVGDEIVILDLSSGNYFGLNPVGARIWELINEGHSLEHVCEALLAEYDVSREVMESDLARLMEELMDRGLLAEG